MAVIKIREWVGSHSRSRSNDPFEFYDENLMLAGETLEEARTLPPSSTPQEIVNGMGALLWVLDHVAKFYNVNKGDALRTWERHHGHNY